jgi:D-alanyl-D-alanine carboxypeptidase
VRFACAARGPSLPKQIQAQLDAETRANPNILGQSLHIIAPQLGLDQTFVSGENLHATDSIRIASNIKPFVAAAALKLVETGQLSLDAPIGPYLSASMQELFKGKEAVLSKITLRHLLTNTSGLQDYGNSQIFQAIAYVPTAFGYGWPWTARSQVWFSLNLLPIGPPGERFDYADTNFLLASDMIAKATAKANAGIALDDLLGWEALSAKQTYWEGYQPKPINTILVRQFRGLIEDTNLDVSFDRHGGGGLVMTISALAHAHRAIVRGRVFERPLETTRLMQTPSGAAGAGTYAMGISSQVIDGVTCYTHGGRWGTMALHCPSIELTIARSTGQANAGPYDGVSDALVGILKQIPRTE